MHQSLARNNECNIYALVQIIVMETSVVESK